MQMSEPCVPVIQMSHLEATTHPVHIVQLCVLVLIVICRKRLLYEGWYENISLSPFSPIFL